MRRRAVSSLREVPSRVQQHVGQRVPHFARCAQDVQVVAIGEHGPVKAEDTVHGPGKSRTERLHSAREIARARGLDHGVHVIVLDRVVNQPEVPALARSRQAAFQLSHELHAA